MAAAKTKKRSIIIGNKEYTMPQKMSTMAYLRYLEVRDSIMDTEAKQALYTRQQFMDMMDVIVEMYGNQFTTDDMLDTETGMTPDAIVMEFKVQNTSKEKSLEETVEHALRQIQEKQYDTELLARGITKERIRHYGFAFRGKKVLIGN